jgi:4-amino-4-deoxy-L-arabinose transferase-like glycosyltransferase
MSDGRLAGGILGAAFLVRLTLYLGTAIFGTDSAQFLLMADWMSEGRFEEALSITYHPLYPMLIAALNPLMPGGTEVAGFWISMVLGSAAVLPLFFLVRAIFGRPAAFFAALIYAFQWHTVELHADVMTEGTFCFFLYGAAWLCWRAMEDPSLVRFIVTGIAAVAAYLTRPEGILAVALVIGWPLADLAFRRERPWRRLASVSLCAVTMLLLAFPFLLWVHSKMGAWKLSAKSSVHKPESVTPIVEAPKERNRYVKLTRAIGQVTGILAPFALLGFLGLKGHGLRGPLFFFSFPLGYLAGLLLALRTHPWMSYRYVVPLMGMLLVLAALGMVVALRFMERHRPGLKWKWVAAGVLLFSIFAPCVKAFRPHRQEDEPLREAGLWILARGGTRVCSTVDKIGFFIGNPVITYDETFEEFKKRVVRERPQYIVYREEDLEKGKPAYLDRLHEVGATEPVLLRGVRIHPVR